MNSSHWHRRALVLPFLILLLGTLIGGQLNRVDVRGVIIDDTTGSPVPGVTVGYGSRQVATGDDGQYELDNLPRGVRLDAFQRYYGHNVVLSDTKEKRITPLTITFEVKDAVTGKGVDTPEARQPDDTQIGKGTNSGEMVVGPYPPRGTVVLICAKDYQSAHVTPKGYLLTVQLNPSAGAACPPLNSPPPPESPAPSGSAAPTPSPTAPPSATP